ncbi:MAG TPA: arylsulfatase [Bryobacteraceae bacterium]|nr:arylsulfatase [Bryobacteraceae bacterium]
MNRRSFLRAASACAAPLLPGGLAAASTNRPNIVVIMADDLGYGDVGCYGAKRVSTPNIDRLASRGIRFTDGHSSSATCTPSRYAFLTGEYPWRRPGTNVLPGDASLIIEPGRPTLPSILKGAGYTTGCVGKWHLGLGTGNVDWNGEVKPGPLELGYDYSFLLPATGDRVPCVYLENHRVVGLDPKDPISVSYAAKIGNEPTGRENPDLLKVKPSHGHDMTIVNGISRIGYMTGGKSARWVDETVADTITDKAASFIERNRANPFFLYFGSHDIHVPRVPHDRFRGKSGCGVRCDVIQELDACVGRLMTTLDKLKLTDNTLIVFTSDNGPIVDDGYADRAVEELNGHAPAGALRGGKYSIYEAGTRVPFIASWPARIKPGVSGALVAQQDLLASFAALSDRPVPANGGPDSFNVLPALLGESKTGRDHLVEHAGRLALRKSQWKMIPARPVPARRSDAVVDIPGPDVELYDLASDPAEGRNVAKANPELVTEMSAMLERIRSKPASRP